MTFACSVKAPHYQYAISKSQKRQNPYLHAQIGVLRNES